MKRRDFIKNATAGVVLPYLLNGFSLKAMAGAPFVHALHGNVHDDRVLVLIQLNGGNDGLNTVIPLSEYSLYKAARSNIAIPEQKVLKLANAEGVGLHPSMEAFYKLCREGRAGIVQAVGYPKPDFSHFRAADIWLTGSGADNVLTTGWAGRYLDSVFPGFPVNYPCSLMPDPLAIQVGAVLSGALQGPVFNMGMAIKNPANFYDLIEEKTEIDVATRVGEQLDYLKTVSLKTDQYASVVKQAALRVKKQSDRYPPTGKNPLADQLKIVARLIAGGLRTKVYMVNTGSFDTHSAQTDLSDTTAGVHASLLRRVSEAIQVFMEDLDFLQAGDRVMGMTFSEFGRRIKSNASGGTDHGAAAPVFYFGNKVNGKVLGVNPDLPAQAGANDNIAMQHDFRSLYTTLLQKWLHMEEAEVQKVLNGRFDLLPMV